MSGNKKEIIRWELLMVIAAVGIIFILGFLVSMLTDNLSKPLDCLVELFEKTNNSELPWTTTDTLESTIFVNIDFGEPTITIGETTIDLREINAYIEKQDKLESRLDAKIDSLESKVEDMAIIVKEIANE